MDWQWNRDFIVLSLVSRYTILHSTTHEWEFGCWRPAVHEKMSPCDTMPQFAHIIIINIGSLNACKKFFHSRSIFLFTQFSLSPSLFISTYINSRVSDIHSISIESNIMVENTIKKHFLLFLPLPLLPFPSHSNPFGSNSLPAGWYMNAKSSSSMRENTKVFDEKSRIRTKVFAFWNENRILLVSPHPPLSLHRCMQK